MQTLKNGTLLLFWLFSLLGIEPSSSASALSIINISQSTKTAPLYEKFEIKFDISGTVAENLQWPYDANNIPGLNTKSGITVDGLFLPPGEADWGRAHVVPAFLYQPTLIDRSVTAEDANNEWIYPKGDAYWLLRFAPGKKGTWHYKIRAQDDSNYPSWYESAIKSFTAKNPNEGVHGFVQVSPHDNRYFEFSDGTPFTGTGINAADGGIYHAEKIAEKEICARIVDVFGI